MQIHSDFLTVSSSSFDRYLIAEMVTTVDIAVPLHDTGMSALLG